MADLSPFVALLTALGSIAGAVKVGGELLKKRWEKKLGRAYRDSEPEASPQLPAPPAPALSLELKLQAKEIELLRAQYQIDQMQADFRRLRLSLDEAARDQAMLAARLTEQELYNTQLLEEMRRLRMEGPDDAVDRRC